MRVSRFWWPHFAPDEVPGFFVGLFRVDVAVWQRIRVFERLIGAGADRVRRPVEECQLTKDVNWWRR